MTKLSINKLNIAQIFFLLFLVSLFFPIRYVFPNQQAFQTGAYSDFTSISLYLSDILLFLTILFIIFPRGIKSLASWRLVSLSTCITTLVIWLILDLLYHFWTLNFLNYWFFAKYLELIVAYGTTLYLFGKTSIKLYFIRLFVILSSLESILATWQFIMQRSIGGWFHKLGESIISPKILGIAKIVAYGTTYIRGYGTFPHPNLLSAFMVVGVILSIYLLISSESIKLKSLYSLLVFINILGLTVTFSRAGFLALVLALILIFSFAMVSPLMAPKREVWRAIAVTFFSIIICIAIFQPFLLTRTTVSDSASLERIFYAKIGVKMIKDHPIFGLGIGESVLHMQQYSPIKLLPWQIQPIHNYFLLAAAELGIPGALILLWVFLDHLFRLIKKLNFAKDINFISYLLFLISILCAFLLLTQFDHYFYTLQQTQMLLWVTMGIIAAEIKKSPSGDFPTS